MSSPAETLAKAQRGLALLSIFLRKSDCDIAESFTPPFHSATAQIAAQVGNSVPRIRVTDVPNQDASLAGQRFVEYFIDVKATFSLPPTGEAFDEKSIIAHVGATFCVIYELKTELSAEELSAFGTINGIYHLWPYWREHLNNMCTRMMLPPLVLPMMNPSPSTKNASAAPPAEKPALAEK